MLKSLNYSGKGCEQPVDLVCLKNPGWLFSVGNYVSFVKIILLCTLLATLLFSLLAVYQHAILDNLLLLGDLLCTLSTALIITIILYINKRRQIKELEL